jgi:hypothetical protein
MYHQDCMQDGARAALEKPSRGASDTSSFGNKDDDPPDQERPPQERGHAKSNGKEAAAAKGGLLEEVRRRSRLIASEGQDSDVSDPIKSPTPGHGARSSLDSKRHDEEAEATQQDRENPRQGVPARFNSARDAPDEQVVVVVGHTGAPLNVCSK